MTVAKKQKRPGAESNPLRAKEEIMLNQISSPASPDVHIIEQEVQTYQKTLVGAYCRVSTDMEVQKSSLQTQMMAYKRIIADHPGWVLAGIYADEGLSGTSVNRRTEFQRMISDAKAGKLNYILVKSISRFSRNTVDLLQYVRELKQIGVNVYFEKEHIDTGAGSSEFLLSIFGAAAQEEIISLSNNMKVARRMRFAQGKEQWTHIYGYERGWEIVPEEAEVIQRIYRMYVNGNSLTEICDELNNEGIPVSAGKGRWEAHSIAMMMKNEKYAGHILMQKSFIKDPITHEKVSNRDAIIPQYFKRNHHVPIVSEEIWEPDHDDEGHSARRRPVSVLWNPALPFLWFQYGAVSSFRKGLVLDLLREKRWNSTIRAQQLSSLCCFRHSPASQSRRSRFANRILASKTDCLLHHFPEG